MDGVHEVFKTGSLIEYMAAIREDIDRRIDEIATKEDLEEARNDGISIGEVSGEVNGIRKTFIEFCEMFFGPLSSTTIKAMNNCDIEQLNELKYKFKDIRSEDDIIDIINHNK